MQSLANTVRNLVALADRLQRPEAIARLVGWLAWSPISVRGSPGMRRTAADVQEKLRAALPAARFDRETRIGARLTVQEVLQEAGAVLEMLA